MMYTARGNQVFVYEELFLTVHPSHGNDVVTVEQQAKIIADLFNHEFAL